MTSEWFTVIQGVSSCVAVLLSGYAIQRAGKQKQNDQLDDISSTLNDHILEDARNITALQEQVRSLTDHVSDKLDLIIGKL